jgi:hypothetical protein
MRPCRRHEGNLLEGNFILKITPGMLPFALRTVHDALPRPGDFRKSQTPLT